MSSKVNELKQIRRQVCSYLFGPLFVPQSTSYIAKRFLNSRPVNQSESKSSNI